MTRPSPFSVRGRRALMVMRDEREISHRAPPAQPPGHDDLGARSGRAALANQAVDVILMDADSIPIKSDQATLWKGNIPIIALIGTETPSRLKWLLDLQPASFLVKPLRSAGLYTALVVAFDSAQRRVDEAAHIEKLEDRIRSRRVVFAAVLQIMRGHDMSETDAFASFDRPRCGIARR